MSKSLRALCLLCLLACIGCVKSATAPSGSTSTPPSNSNPPSAIPAVTDADLTFCVSETNRHRAMQERAALSRSGALETYATDGARIDAQANKPHQHFTSANGGGVSSAENEILNGAGNTTVTTQSAIQNAIMFFYNEGATGPHYLNMMAGYTQLSCGVYRTATTITVVQDFR